MMAPRIITLADGTRLVAGLDWQPARTGVLAGLSLRGNAALLPHGDRVADGPAAAAGAGALLIALGAGLDGAEQGTWLFVAHLPDSDLWWLGQAEISTGGSAPEPAADRVRPVPASEEFHGTRAALMAAISEIDATTPLAGIAVADEPLAKDISRIGTTAPVVTVAPAPAPAFIARTGVSRRTMVFGGSALAGALALVLALPPVLDRLARSPLAPPPAMIRAALEVGSFAAACTETLADWWPRIAGWQAGARGCALAGHLPETIDLDLPAPEGPPAVTMLLWHRLTPVGGSNPVLGDRASDRVLAAWPHGQRRSDQALLLWRTRTLPLRPGASDLSPDLGPDAGPDAGPVLAALWAGQPGAVKEEGSGFAITASGDPAALFGKAARIAELEPVRLDLSAGDKALLLLRPRSGRNVPATLFEAGHTSDTPSSKESLP